MKKILLTFSLLGLVLASNAQTKSEVMPLKGTPAKESRHIKLGSAFGKTSTKKVRSYGNLGVTIGTTYYDLQTNASMSRRIVNNGNGSISAIWTTSATADAQNGSFSDRGTGYNHKDAATPWLAPSGNKIEPFSQRTGFCNLLNTGSNEYIINHNAASAQSFVYKNNSLGSSIFTKIFSLANTTATDTIIWPKSAISGNNIYVIGTNSNALDSSTQLYFSYSPDAGVTWPTKCIPMPLLTKGQMWASSADSYNIDASGSIVSIVAGTVTTNLYCLRSNDFGSTWEIDTVTTNGLPFGMDNTMQTTHITPTDSIAFDTDGSASVLIDQEGTTHIIYSPIFWSLDPEQTAINIATPASATYSIYFSRSGNSLSHWVPGIQTNFANPVDSIQDCDNDGVFTYGSAHNNGGAANTSGRYSSFNPTNFSQMASINADTIFVVYSAIIDGDTSDLSSALEGQNYRDIFVKVSFNGGGSWNQRVNITNSPKVEDVYPSIAKLVDGNLHIVWQSDLEPGTVLTNGDPADPSGSNIIYLSVPTSFVYTHADDGALVCQSPDFGPDAIKDFYTDKNGNPLFTLTPNPATNQVNITGNIADNKMTVTNSLGQVMDLPITKVNNNTATLQVAGLPNGIYYVQIGNAQFKTTTRFVKQ